MDADRRRAIEAHLRAAGRDERQAPEIYADDAVLEFPQGGERIRGKANIIAFRSTSAPNGGARRLWVNEYVIRYDGKPSHVGIMEFRDDKVIRETIYVGEPWAPPAWRAQWVEPLD